MSSRLMPPQAGAIAAMVRMRTSGSLRVDADRVGVDPAELLEQHRLALHDGHAGRGADVAEAEDRGAVGDDRDHVALEGEVEGQAAVLGDRLAHARHPGHVGDREVVARLERHPGGHLDLAALVHPEGAVERRDHLHPVEARRRGHDRVGVILVGGVDHQLADQRAVARPHEVDRADVAAHRADGRRELPKEIGLGRVHLDAEGDAVLGARRDGQRGSLRGCGNGGQHSQPVRGPEYPPAVPDTAAPPATGPLLLIDGNSLAYRAFHALPDTISTADGFPTNALYGLAAMMMKMLAEERPGRVVVAWDAPGRTFRHEQEPTYKANRQATPDLFREQAPHFRPMMEAFGFVNTELDGLRGRRRHRHARAAGRGGRGAGRDPHRRPRRVPARQPPRQRDGHRPRRHRHHRLHARRRARALRHRARADDRLPRDGRRPQRQPARRARGGGEGRLAAAARSTGASTPSSTTPPSRRPSGARRSPSTPTRRAGRATWRSSAPTRRSRSTWPRSRRSTTARTAWRRCAICSTASSSAASSGGWRSSPRAARRPPFRRPTSRSR